MSTPKMQLQPLSESTCSGGKNSREYMAIKENYDEADVKQTKNKKKINPKTSKITEYKIDSGNHLNKTMTEPVAEDLTSPFNLTQS